MRAAISSVISLAIAGYRHSLGLVLPTACKHYPSCSVYAEQAIRTHGVTSGAWMAARRILRCHPLSRGGYDPVPSARKAHLG